MAASLLFDLDQIDLTQVRFSEEDVSRVNPQAGHMRQINSIIWMADDITEILGVKQVRDDEFWVAGHIPGRPLFPGVLMIEAVAQLSCFLFQQQAARSEFFGFTRCDDVVFRGLVVPGDTLYLLARQIEHRPRRFISQTQAIVGGKLVFQAKITGMPM